MKNLQEVILQKYKTIVKQNFQIFRKRHQPSANSKRPTKYGSPFRCMQIQPLILQEQKQKFNKIFRDFRMKSGRHSGAPPLPPAAFSKSTVFNEIFEKPLATRDEKPPGDALDSWRLR